MKLGRSRARSQLGFTMVELIACIVIIAILGAVTAPSFFDNQTFAARGFADEVANSLRYAQRVAIASNCGVRVTINAAGYTSWQQAATGNRCNTAGAWNRAVVRNDRTALSGVSPAGINIAPSTTIEFRPEGDVLGGSVNLQIGAHVISVVGATGRVNMQ